MTLRIATLAVFCSLLGGCLWATAASDKMAGYEVRGIVGHDNAGGGVHVVGGMAGVYASAELDGRRYRRADDPNTYDGAGIGLSLRASPLGIIATDHRLERYFDFGAEAGASASLIAGVPTTLTAVGAGWVGGWVELGTVPIANGYLALTGNIRTVSLSDTWRDQVVIGVGLAWRVRSLLDAGELRIRD